MPTPLGAVLAGGAGSRMGTDKASVELDGSTMLNRVIDAVSDVAPHVVVLGGDREGQECWPDITPVPGPLAGVATALNRMSEDRVLVVAVDNPFVTVSTLTHLAKMSSSLPIVPVDYAGVRQVTCAVYPKSVAAVALEEAESGGSIQTLLDRVSFEPVTPDVWRSWGEDGRSWYSVDTPESLRAGLEKYG
ncbi:MAG: molybdenum cofactor guanylyltransferase [Acidimicrobiia bacterium]